MLATDKRILVVGAEATTAELGTWWKERSVTLPPWALGAESAHRLGMRHLPVALVVGRDGRITWVKEGYSPGDEAEWRRQLAGTEG